MSKAPNCSFIRLNYSISAYYECLLTHAICYGDSCIFMKILSLLENKEEKKDEQTSV
jgi:hypothetical protein